MKMFGKSLALAVLLSSAAIPAQAQTLKDFLNAAVARWNTPTDPFHVIGNVYYVGTKGIASYLIIGPSGNSLIYTPMPEATGQIKTNIGKLGFKLSDIKMILNTHAHFDHTGGFAEIKHDTGAELVAGTADKPLLEGGYYPGQETVSELKFPPVKVDRAVRDGDVVTLGSLGLTAHATPGHSPGCTTWTMDVTEGGEAHKIVFFCSATRSKERRVGKEWRCRRAPEHERNKNRFDQRQMLNDQERQLQNVRLALDVPSDENEK